MSPTLAWVVGGWAVGLVLLGAVVAALRRRGRVRGRVFQAVGKSPASAPADARVGPLGRWLALAGYRAPGAAAAFAALTAVGLAVGIAASLALQRGGLVRAGAAALGAFPGGVGDLFLPAVYAMPWLALAVPAALPYAFVSAAGRRRVEAIEQDLPLTLELLSTLSEAGLGFDAALDRVLDAQPSEPPLAQEFRIFQRELLAGVPRVAALRRLADRADVLSLTILTSALVQADQVGSGVAEVLRRQAEDLRNRRRERALAKANALPVKLMFPLVACFLPGLFVVTLGPTFYQFFQFADSVIRSRGLK